MRSNGPKKRRAARTAPPVSPLGGAIRARRRALGLGQVELCDLAGVGPAFIYQLEHGKPTVRLDKVLAVLHVLGLELHLRPGHGGVVADAPSGGSGE